MSPNDEQADEDATNQIDGLDSNEQIGEEAQAVAEEARQLAREIQKEKNIELSLSDRDRGILSNTDREFLFDKKEYKHKQSALNRKRDIRNRVANALQDFILLNTLISGAEIEKIFNHEMDDDNLDKSLRNMISFVYNGIDHDRGRLEDIISKGVRDAINKHKTDQKGGEATHVSTIIDIERTPDVDELYDKLQEGKTDQLSNGEVGALIRSGKLDSDDVAKLEESDEPFSWIGSGIESLID